MSDPARDHAARKRAKERERYRREYTPLVIWVKVPAGRGTGRLLGWIHERVTSLPYVTALSKSKAPYSYATDGTIREEKADGAAHEKYRCFECEGQLRKMHEGEVCLDCGLVYLPEGVQVARKIDTEERPEAGDER